MAIHIDHTTNNLEIIGGGTLKIGGNFADAFASGTIVTFGTTTSPTGWTKLVDHDNKALRVVSGTVGSGGTLGFTSAFSAAVASATSDATGTVGSTTLSTAQMPSHDHAIWKWVIGGAGGAGGYIGNSSNTSAGGGNDADGVRFSGSSGSHNHSFTPTSHSHNIAMDVQYVDVIRSQKD